MKKLLLIIVVISAILVTGCTDTSDEQLSMQEKIEDFEYMYEVISNCYPFLEVNKRLNNVDWISNKDVYLERIMSTQDDEEFLTEMSLIIKDLNNSHTNIIDDEYLYKSFRNAYLETEWFNFLDDEEVALRYGFIGSNYSSNSYDPESTEANRDLILRDVVVDDIGYIYLPQMKSDYIQDMKLIADYINTLENHKALIIDIRGNSGGRDEYWHNIVSNLIDEDITIKGYMLFRNNHEVIENYMNKRLCTNDIYEIIQLPEDVIDNAPIEILTSFTNFCELNQTIPANSTSKFDGNIYLLVDEIVYSSSESFAIFCKDSGFATIIGEKTSGDGGGFDPLLFNLKNSGLIVRMSSNMYLTTDGTCNEEFQTIPHYEISNVDRTSNFKEDQCINKVLELEDILNN